MKEETNEKIKAIKIHTGLFIRNRLRTGIGRTPCPLEIVTAKPAGNV